MANFLQKKISFAKIIFVAFALLSFLQISPVLALEISYPKIGTLEITDASKPEEIVKYFYVLSVSLVGIIAFLSLLWGGIIWLTSGGNPSKLGEAKQKISASLMGIILILSSYLILTLINPNLTILNIEKPPPAILITGADIKGYILCKNEGGVSVNRNREGALEAMGRGDCIQLSRTGWNINIPQEYINAGFSISSFPDDPGNYYAILLPRNPNDPNQPSKSFEQCNVLLSKDITLNYGSLIPGEARYIMSGQYSETADPEIKITFCEDVNCTIENPLAPTIGFEQWEPFKVRAMKINEGAQVEKIILSDETGLNGACFITNENEPSFVFAFAHSSKLDETDVDAGPYSEVSSRIVLPKVSPLSSSSCNPSFGVSPSSGCTATINPNDGSINWGNCTLANNLTSSAGCENAGDCYLSSEAFYRARDFIDIFNGLGSVCSLRLSSAIQRCKQDGSGKCIRDIDNNIIYISASSCHRPGTTNTGNCADFNVLPDYTTCKDVFYQAATESNSVVSFLNEYRESSCPLPGTRTGDNFHVNF